MAYQPPNTINLLSKPQLPVLRNCVQRAPSPPDRSYFDSGLFVTLNSDDPPMFGANLLDEYVLAHDEYAFTPDQLRELAANAAEASFLPPRQKNRPPLPHRAVQVNGPKSLLSAQPAV